MTVDTYLFYRYDEGQILHTRNLWLLWSVTFKKFTITNQSIQARSLAVESFHRYAQLRGLTQPSPIASFFIRDHSILHIEDTSAYFGIPSITAFTTSTSSERSSRSAQMIVSLRSAEKQVAASFLVETSAACC